MPHQGTQLEIEFAGRRERVGFCNTFAATSPGPQFDLPALSAPVECWRDMPTGQVHGLRGPGFTSAQFHPESVFTEHGPEILGWMLASALGGD